MLRSGAGNAPPRISNRTSSIDKVPQLIGQLNSDGIASLTVDPLYQLPSRSNPPHSLKSALDAATDSRRNSLGDTTSETSEEDYDNLKHDPAAVVGGGKGGGYREESGSPEKATEMNGNGHANGNANGHKTYETLKISSQTRPGVPRLKSIPVTLNRLKEKGRYILTADDEALRDILKSGLEREKDPAGAKKRRSKFSDLVFTRQFTAFDRQNADSADSPFHGFFTLFWLGTALFTIKLGAENWRQYGNILGSNEIMGLMFRRDVMVLGLSDGVLCGATGFGLILQWLIFKGWISWDKEGWIIQSVWEALYLVAVLGWTLFREWPWTHTVFFVLHGIVMLMKQHSYAFYNGHLSEAYKMRATLQRKLKQLDAISPVKSPSETTPSVSSLVTSYLDQRPTATDLNQRRKSVTGDEGASNILQVAAAIESGEPLDVDQIQTFERIIKWEIDALSEDLKGKCTKGDNIYPRNLTLTNHYEYIVLPTLVYELEYPRSDTINWYYVAEKGAAVVGVLGVMNMVSQAFIYPVVVSAMEMRDAGVPLVERLSFFPWMLSDLIFPFMMEYMMTWFLR
ncbi:hypothetical protein EG329_007818 [Mollisiaceae sp. DMI_Dod_QoI]|nr:hypothetical protein EG329_007818 [Helotiales sp. DMI_Dod_QoI]